jgi:threonine dehydratase
MTSEAAPDLDDIAAAWRLIEDSIIVTPVLPLLNERITPYLPEGASCHLKLELFQQTGSFKARGALLNVRQLPATDRVRGVTTVSAGNHAIAVAWAARQEAIPAKVVMMASADPVRVAACRALGAEVLLMPDVHAAFAETERIVAQEGRALILGFEGRTTCTGTATLGAEFMRQVSELEAVVIPVGGGGLIGGMARAIKLINPACKVYGVEPEGADSLSRSLAAGSPQRLDKVSTIADSLGAPMALPYSFGLAQRHVDKVVLVPDSALLTTMVLIYDATKLAVEPAGAASTAAAIGPLRADLVGKRVGLIACGSNIGEAKFAGYVAQGRELLALNPN